MKTKLLIDTYYLYNIFRSLPEKQMVSGDKELSTMYHNKCLELKLEMENTLKILLQASNNPNNIAELFVHLFPGRSESYLKQILELKDFTPQQLSNVMNDLSELGTTIGVFHKLP